MKIQLVRPTEVCGVKYKVRKMAKSLVKTSLLLFNVIDEDQQSSWAIFITFMGFNWCPS